MCTPSSPPSGDSVLAAARQNRQLAEGILALSLCRDEADILATALAQVRAIYPAPHWAIGDVEAGDKQVVILEATPDLEHQFGRSIQGMRFPILGRTFSTSLYDEHRVTFVADAPRQPAEVHPEFVANFKVQSLLGIPLLFEDRVVGAIFGAAFLGEAPLEEDAGAFEALHTLARVAAIALQRVRARRALESALDRTRILSEVFRETAMAQSEEELIRMLFQLAPRLAPLPSWWFNIYDRELRQSRTKYWTPSLEETLSLEAIEAVVGIDEHPLVAKTHLDRELLWFQDVKGHPWFPPAMRADFPARSLLCVPLWDDRQGVGVLSGASMDPDEPISLDADQLEALERLGQAAGMALSRLEAHRQQAESEQRYKALFDHAIEAVLILDESRYLMANQAACRMLGHTEEEIRGQKPGFFSPEFQPGGEKSADLALAFAARALTEGPQRFPWLHNGPGGTILETEVTLASYMESERRYFQVIVRDMTEPNRLAEEKKALEQQLFQSQKLESLGVLAGGIAHDFNNLLMGIMGHAGLALEFGRPAEGVKEHLEAIQAAGHRASDLTRQMLAYSGRGHFVIQLMDLSGQVEEMISLLEVSIPKSVTLELQLKRDLPWISADAAQLQQVIMNLVINGAEAIGNGQGRITLRTYLSQVDPGNLPQLFEGSVIEPGAYVTLEVRDTGAGMDEATLARIFEPFFSTKFTGRGLGLSAILGIVRGHRGGLAVETQPGEGTVFRVFLPPSTDYPPILSASPVTEGHVPQGALVLVVDDEATVRTVARQILETGGYRVEEAWDGDLGVERLEALGEAVSLVLLDMTMPRLGGEAAFRLMRALRPGLPILLSSGFSEQEAMRNLHHEGLAGFLQKPYGPKELLARVRAILGKA